MPLEIKFNSSTMFITPVIYVPTLGEVVDFCIQDMHMEESSIYVDKEDAEKIISHLQEQFNL